MNPRRALEALVVFLLLVGAVVYYIIRKPVYDSFSYGLTPYSQGTSLSVDLSQGTASYTSPSTGSKPMRVFDLTIPTLGQLLNSSESSGLIIAKLGGGPLGYVPALVQFNGKTISVLWPTQYKTETWLSAPFTGPGTYTGSYNGSTTTLVVGDNLPCPPKSLALNLSSIPSAQYSNVCGYSSSLDLSGDVTNLLTSPSVTIATFTPNDTGADFSSISLEYSQGNLRVVDNFGGVWVSLGYTGPGNYSTNIGGTSISITLDSSFPDPVCAGNPDGMVLSTQDQYNYGGLFPTAVNQACKNGKVVKCVNQIYGDGSGCDNALVQSCGQDKQNCANLGKHCYEEADCDESDCITVTGGIYNGKFKIPSGASYQAPAQIYTC